MVCYIMLGAWITFYILLHFSPNTTKFDFTTPIYPNGGSRTAVG